MNDRDKPTQETLEKWHSDPENWKLGIFYFNKEDKRIFPPKKIRQLGWTINFANPVSIVIFVGFIVVFSAVIGYISLLKN